MRDNAELAIDMLLADVKQKTIKHCTMTADGIHYSVRLISPGRCRRQADGAITRDMAVRVVGEALVARADAEPGVLQVGW